MSETIVLGVEAGAAGTQVSYTDQSPQLKSGEFGLGVILAPFAKGMTGAVHRVLDDGHFREVLGRVLDDDYSGVAAQAFFDRAKGAGKLHGYRVPSTTGLAADGKQGQLRLLGRECLSSRLITHGVDGEERTIAQTAKALSYGEWSGPFYRYYLRVDDSTISGNTIALGTAHNSVWVANELAGRTFKITSFATEFTIVSHTATGASGPVLTLDRTFAGYTATAGLVACEIYRNNVDDESERMEATIRVQDDPTRPTTRWSATVGSDGAAVSPKFTDLDLNDQAAIQRDIAAAVLTGYAEVDLVDDDQTVADAALPQARPCNWSGVALPETIDSETDLGLAKVSSAGVVDIQIHELVIATATGGRPTLSAAPTNLATAVPQMWEITFSAAAVFSATAIDPYTGATLATASQLGAGATGAVYPGTNWTQTGLVQFTIPADGTIAVGTVVRLWVLPLPSNLKDRNCYLYPAAWSGTGRAAVATDPGSNVAQPGVNTAYRVIGNTANTVTLQATQTALQAGLQAPKAPCARGTDVTNSHDTTTTPTFIYNVQFDNVDKHAVNITLTMDNIGAAATTAEVAANLNTKDAAAQNELFFYADSTNRLCVAYAGGDAGAYVDLSVENGTLNAIVGLTDTTDHAGDAGAVMRLEWDQALRGARYESSEVTFANLQAALSTDPSSALVQWIESQAGLVTLIMPGVSDATTVQAAVDFARSVGCWYDPDFANSLADELAARAALQANVTPQRVFAPFYPSWGETTKSPRTPNGVETQPLSGAVMGVEFAIANDPSEGVGWHKAGAGRHALLSPYFRRLLRDATATPTLAELIQAPLTDETILNPAGIRPIVHSGPSIYIFGDEAPNTNYAGTYWVHKQKCMLHLAAEFRANLSALVYHLNNAGQRGQLVRDIGTILRPKWSAGWFDPIEDGKPPTFQSCCRIQSNLTNNPTAVRNLGKIVASVQVRIVNTTKIVDIKLGTSGVSVAEAA